MKKVKFNGDVVSNTTGKIYEWIDLEAIYPALVAEKLEEANGEDVEVTLTTKGGSVFAGQEIFDLIKNYSGKTTVKISGLVASVGTLIACAFDEVLISPVATYMIHNPTISDVSGEKADMEKAVQLLDTIETTLLNTYAEKTGLDKEELAELMTKETFMTAQTALDYGFADKIETELSDESSLQLVAGFSLDSKVLEKLQGLKKKEERELANARLRLLKIKGETK